MREAAKKSRAVSPRATRTSAPKSRPVRPATHDSPLARPKARFDEPDVRLRILHASRELIEREGLSALSMREVARRAGVSHQAPYNHFPDREAILGALVEEGFAILRAKLVSALADGKDAPARLCGGVRAYVEFAVNHPGHFRLMFRPELVNLDNCPGAQAEGDATFQLFTSVMAECVEQGLPAEPSMDTLIALGWSVGHGLACLILDGPLTKKLPHAQRDAIIEGVAVSFASLLRARMTPPARKRAPTK